MDHGQHALAELVDLERMREVLDRFSEATGLVTALVSLPDHELLVSAGSRTICAAFHRASPASELHCRACRQGLTERLEAARQPTVLRCESGLVDGGAPIVVHGAHLANVFAGQALLGPPDRARFRQQAAERGYPAEAYLAALEQVPIVTEEGLEKALRFLAEMVVLLAERGQSERELAATTAALRESEQRYRLLSLAADNIWVLSLEDLRFTFASDSTRRMYGFTPEEYLALRLDQQMPPSSVEKVMSLLGEELEKENQPEVDPDRARVFEIEEYVRGGGTVWSEVKASFLRDQSGRPVSVLGITRDITRRKRRERLDQIQRGVANDLAVATSLAEMAERVFIRLTELEEIDGGGLYVEKPSGAFELCAHTGLSREFVERVRCLEAGSPQVLLLREGKTLNRPYAELGLETDAVRRREGLRSLTIIPIREKGRVIGGINLASRQVDALPDDLLRFAESVSAQLGEALTRRILETRLQQSEQRMELALRGADLGTWDMNPVTGEVAFNDRWAAMLGYELGELAPRESAWERLLHPDDLTSVKAAFEAHLRGETEFYETEHRLRHRSGEWVWVLAKGRVIARDEEGHALRACGTHLDITHRKRADEEQRALQERLVQSQRMEAVGRLAGGVAHDFNNLLTGITISTELAASSLDPASPVQAELGEIREAARRAAGLTAQLLAFSRRQMIEPRVIQPNQVIGSSQTMLRRVIGEDIKIVFRPAPDLWNICTDPTQLDQILVNLTVNARDAMPDGGTLTIETRNQTLDPQAVRAAASSGAEAGDYVLLVVSDSGQGMDEETMQHIFEPFFSTKGERGTGLGLSTVYGIVQQHRGFIEVSSRPGAGARFTLHFPAVREEAVAQPPVEAELSGGTETVLLVEDEEVVRRLARRILEQHGYRVIECASGAEALVSAERLGEIDLLLTDVVMPGISGWELHERLSERRAELKVLFMSGYTDDQVSHRRVLDGSVPFLPKPFTVELLVRKVRETLDG